MAISIDEASPSDWNNAAYAAHFGAANAALDPTPRDIEALNLLLSRGSFGELPLVTRAYVFLLHQTGKIRTMIGDMEVKHPNWSSSVSYRVSYAEPPKTKPSIDWSVFSTAFHWLARDKDGCAYVFASEPSHAKSDRMWQAAPWVRVDKLPGYKSGDCDWKDSLVERPVNA